MVKITRRKRNERKNTKYKSKISVLAIFLIIITTLSIEGYRFLLRRDRQVFIKETETEAKDFGNLLKNNNLVLEPPAYVNNGPLYRPKFSQVVISSVGDCTIGTDDKFSYTGSLPSVLQKNNNDFSYFFKNVSSIFRQDDITIANLETTFTTASIRAEKEFNFKAPPEYAKALIKGNIDAVNISNNHIRDYLDKGLQDTVSTLNAENIGYFGEGQKWTTIVNGINFGFLGYKGYTYDDSFLKNLKADIENLKKQNSIVVINFHWGDEGTYYPNNTQKFLAHFAIDNGADLIIGHHPHVIQGIEKYKNKIICYSLGNFCFGGNMNPPDKDTFILQTKFNFKNDKLRSYEIKIIPCSISTVSYLNDYCPTPYTDRKKDEFLNKLNKYSPGLGFTLSDGFFLIDVNN